MKKRKIMINFEFLEGDLNKTIKCFADCFEYDESILGDFTVKVDNKDVTYEILGRLNSNDF